MIFFKQNDFPLVIYKLLMCLKNEIDTSGIAAKVLILKDQKKNTWKGSLVHIQNWFLKAKDMGLARQHSGHKKFRMPEPPQSQV